jgi:hypothetical protein
MLITWHPFMMLLPFVILRHVVLLQKILDSYQKRLTFIQLSELILRIFIVIDRYCMKASHANTSCT